MLFLGMATQAFITALLAWFNIVDPEPMQQAVAGVAFLVIWLAVERGRKRQ